MSVRAGVCLQPCFEAVALRVARPPAGSEDPRGIRLFRAGLWRPSPVLTQISLRPFSDFHRRGYSTPPQERSAVVYPSTVVLLKPADHPLHLPWRFTPCENGQSLNIALQVRTFSQFLEDQLTFWDG